MHTEASELETRLITRITREGPITFRDFMESVLYDPELGYYCAARPRIGPEGDFFTSSNLHPVLGAVLAQAFVDLIDQTAKLNESPRGSLPATIVEFGAGTGRLTANILTAIAKEHPETHARLTYIVVEISDEMRKHQRAELKSFLDVVRWMSLSELENSRIGGVVFSNEFIDALPVHRVRFNSGVLEEQIITADSGSQAGRLRSGWRPSSDARLMGFVERIGVTIEDRQIIEVNLDALEWLRIISAVLINGFVLTIDYGDLAPALFSPQRRHGTLRCFRRQQIVDSPLERVGEQDITSSVNFTALQEYGRDYGLEPIALETQTSFLMQMGLIQRVADTIARDQNESLAVKNLVVPGGIGDYCQVLIQRLRPSSPSESENKDRD